MKLSWSLLLVLSLVCPCVSFAQSANASLTGLVDDATKAVISGASITAINTQTGVRTSTTTNSSGQYVLPALPPGRYRLEVDKQGFKGIIEAGIVLHVEDVLQINFHMAIGSMSETVTVNANELTLNTVDASLGSPFNSRQIEELPMEIRNVVNLLSLQAGVTQTGEVIGAARDQNNITLDGADVNDNQNAGLGALGNSTGTPLPGLNGRSKGIIGGTLRAPGFNAALPVPLDSVEEFRVVTGGEGAESGRSSGGQVALVTKGGTNRFHGSAYEFNRDTVFSANDYFNKRSGVPRQPLVRNQFGFALGGPVKKDRVMFFFNYERRTDRSSVTQLEQVPSAAMRQGVLTYQTTDGTTASLDSTQLQTIDPLHLGIDRAVLSMLAQYPAGNDPSSGYDGGLNFVGYRFNAPQPLTDNAYVGRVDWHVDSAGKHTISMRGTLAGDHDTQTPASFPGQPANNVLLNNSRGLAATYTGSLTPSSVNVLTFGLTRIGDTLTGPTGTAFTQDVISSSVNYNTRGYARISPTYNIADSYTWTRDTHTVEAGTNIRIVRNGYTNFINAWPTYSYLRTSLQGLGTDWLTSMQAYLQATNHNSSLANSNAVVSASGDLLGLIAEADFNNSYDKAGNPLSIGTPAKRNFAANEYDVFLDDRWRLRPNFIVTVGLRYENNTPPWETRGLQVAPTISLQDYWAARIKGAEEGIPSNISAPTESYQLAGPANGKPGWFGRSKLDFAPRVALAYAPQQNGSLFSKLIGAGGVIRGGATLVYSRFGSDIAVQYDASNPFGLTEDVYIGPYNFATAPRYAATLPPLPQATAHSYPYTPQPSTGEYVGINSDLRSPYTYVFNASIGRHVGKDITLELGYAGRFSHSLLLQNDIGGVSWNFRDPANGTLLDAETALRNLYLQLSGNNIHLTPAVSQMVSANPGLVPPNAFIEKYFASLTNAFFPGSASANYLYMLMSNGMSDTDTINEADRTVNANGQCYTVTGCFSFWPSQQGSLNVWTNKGAANYNSGTLSIRRVGAHDLVFNFNYTLSHSIDNGGGAEAGGGVFGGIALDPYSNRAWRGSSDFDVRHNINANVIYRLPLGTGKAVLGNVSGITNQMIGNWQLTAITRYNSGLPTAVYYAGVYPTSYNFGAIAYPISSNYSVRNRIDSRGNPGVFANPSASASNWLPMLPGTVGKRAALRLAGYSDYDIGVAKSFQLPWEGHHVQVRGEAFNAFNHANFVAPWLDASNPTTFGEYTADSGPRVIQFGVRYDF